MLDDTVQVPKFRFCLFDWTVFSPDEERMSLNLENIRRLIYSKSPSWQIRYIYNEQSKFRAIEIRKQIEKLGLSFYDSYCVPLISDLEDIQMLIYECDLVYIPSIQKTLPVNFLLRPPQTAKLAVEAVAYFSNSLEPFNRDNLYNFYAAHGNKIY